MVKKAVIGISTLAILMALSAADAKGASGFKVIASPQVKGTTMSRQMLAAVFLGKVERWGDGTRIMPIDLSAMSPVRATFSEATLGMPTMAVRRYWEERLMGGGGIPPMVKTSEEELIAAVAASQGAIGYVSEDVQLPESVKVLSVQ